MGQQISKHHLRNAATDRVSGLKYLIAESTEGHALHNDFEWARRYAAANRESMLEAIASSVLDPFGVTVDGASLIHLDHNHVQREFHHGSAVWIHRKGAQRLATNEKSVIPGSMGTTTYTVAGRGNADSLNSCSHGAGRSMSRKVAVQKLTIKNLKRETRNVDFHERNLNRLLDESPSAYKDIRLVMKAQRPLVRILDMRTPLICHKGN